MKSTIFIVLVEFLVFSYSFHITANDNRFKINRLSERMKEPAFEG